MGGLAKGLASGFGVVQDVIADANSELVAGLSGQVVGVGVRSNVSQVVVCPVRLWVLVFGRMCRRWLTSWTGWMLVGVGVLMFLRLLAWCRLPLPVTRLR